MSLYHEFESLFVTIHKAKDLLFCDSKECATYISIHIPFTNQSRNTKVGEVMSNYNEYFVFHPRGKQDVL